MNFGPSLTDNLIFKVSDEFEFANITANLCCLREHLNLLYIFEIFFHWCYSQYFGLAAQLML